MAAAIKCIDLNSDLGESYGRGRMGDDTAMLSIVTSANVACGGHASDPDTMFQTLSLAREQSVVVGARVRAAAGLTQKALACQAGLHVSSVRRLERFAEPPRRLLAAQQRPHDARAPARVHVQQLLLNALLQFPVGLFSVGFQAIGPIHGRGS